MGLGYPELLGSFTLPNFTTCLDTMTESNQRLRVAIVGAGIGGLTLSSALGILGRGQDLELDIYEGATHISEIGAGINFWPRTWEIMKALGMDEELARMLPEVPDLNKSQLVFEIRKSDQKEGVHIENMIMKGGAIRLHRAGLQKALIDKLSGRLHLSHRLVSYEETEKEVRLYFEDGSSATCDILIGMDGIKSVVRKQFLKSEGLLKSPSFEPVWSGTYAYRGTVPFDKLSEILPGHGAIERPMKYIGKLKHLITYPLHNRTVNVLALVTDLSKEGTEYQGQPTTYCEQKEVLDTFVGWEPEVQALLQCITKPTKWALRSLVPLERYARGRVLIAGDAAHAMTPHQGAGAGQAVEDAYIIASLLSHKSCTAAAVPTVAEIYNDIRLPTGNRVLQDARNVGRLTQLVAPGFEDVMEGDTTVPLEKLQALFGQVDKKWEWVWKQSAEDDRMKALNMLESSDTSRAVVPPL